MWSYADPLPESGAVKDLLCFYDERVDLEVDGAPGPRAATGSG